MYEFLLEHLAHHADTGSSVEISALLGSHGGGSSGGIVDWGEEAGGVGNNFGHSADLLESNGINLLRPSELGGESLVLCRYSQMN